MEKTGFSIFIKKDAARYFCVWLAFLVTALLTTGPICFASANPSSQKMDETEPDITAETKGEILYRKTLSQYIVEILDLDKYDLELQESDERFLPKDDKDKSDAQKADLCGLTYIYIRNDLHFERLPKKDRILLEETAEDITEDSQIPQKVIDLVKDTWPNIISYEEIQSEEDRNILTYYDESMTPDFVTIDTLELKIATSPEWDKDGNYVDASHEGEKADKLEEFADKMEAELKGKLGNVPIRVFPDL